MNEILKKMGYALIKEYPNFILCRNEKGFRECFNLSDLGLVEETPAIYEGTRVKRYEDEI